MTVPIKIHDNSSIIKIKPKDNDNVHVKSDCNIDIKRLEALIRELQRTKENLGFIFLDDFIEVGQTSGTIKPQLLNLLISYLINKLSYQNHIYTLVKISEHSLNYVCPDLGVGMNEVEVNVHNGFFYFKESTLDHSKLNNLDFEHSGHTGFAGIEFGTTAEWKSKPTYVPPVGMLVVYTDYAVDSEGNYIPAFKIGDGNAYVGDAFFVGDDIRAGLEEHINNKIIHITQEEREFWNNKLNLEIPQSGSDLLVFTRN